MDFNHFDNSLRDLSSTESISNASRSSPDPDMPPLEPIASRETLSASSSTPVDVVMSDNSTSSRDITSMNTDSSLDSYSHEVEMEYEDPPLPEVEQPAAAPAAPRSNNRRARVDDDDDDERDRRHPSQRITNSSSAQPTRPTTPQPAAPTPASTSSAAAASSSTPSTAPTASSASADSQSSSTPTAEPTNPPPPRQPRWAGAHTHPFPFGGIAVTFDIDGIPIPGFGTAARQAPAPGADAAGARAAGGEAFADLFNNPAFIHELLGIEPDVDDPERADKLLKGLEDVPIGLVRRLERVGGIGTTGGELSGGDSGCAVCWESLIDTVEVVESENAAKSEQKAKEDTEEGKTEQRRIVTLPCAHVFHADCLRPWFSRPKQTTCPTCRFNIDPENLTFTPYRHRQRPAQEQASSTTTSGAGTPQPASEATPAPAPPAASRASSSTANVDEPRGRDTVPSASPPPRRAGSEPPLNRNTRPTAQPEPAQAPFSIPGLPGGQFIFITPPFQVGGHGHAAPTARPAEGAARQDNAANPLPSASTPAGTTSPPPQATATPPNSQARPMYGPLPPPQPPTANPAGMRSGGFPGFPAGEGGVIALDITFPIPASFLGGLGGGDIPAAAGAAPAPTPQLQTQPAAQPQAGPAQAQPQPQATRTGPETPSGQAPGHVPPSLRGFRFPTGGLFGAGLNFGRQPGQAEPVNATDILRAVFDARHAAQPTQPAAQPAQASAQPTSSTGGAAPPPATAAAAPSQGEAGAAPPAGAEGSEAGEGARPTNLNDTAFLRFLMNSLNNPSTLLRLLLSAGLMGGVPGFAARGGAHTHAHDGPKKEWTPPPAPGLSLRQRIEKREREAGLRCSDVSCGIGPSDEEPYISEADKAVRQLSIHAVGDASRKVCGHEFHSSCLVSAERVALKGADAAVVGEDVEVSCPVCRGSGSISKQDWDEGCMFCSE